MMLIATLVLGIVIAALPHVVWLLAWMVGKCFHYTVPYAPFGWTAFALVAVDNTVGREQGFTTINRGNLPKAMEGTGGFRILLTHDPGHWRSEVLPDTDIPLTLSGHTHSAQIRLFGWTPASWMFKEVWGRYDEGGQTLNVNAGLGCTLPVRINCPAEITLITLRKS